MHEYKKCCLLCIKSDECFVTDNSPFVDRLKVIYGTKEFDDTLKHGLFCCSCAGRVDQLYKFIVIALHHTSQSCNFETFDLEDCFMCQRRSIITEKDVTDVVTEFLHQSGLSLITQKIPPKIECCYSCYNFMDFFKELRQKIKTFEELKTCLTSLSSIT